MGRRSAQKMVQEGARLFGQDLNNSISHLIWGGDFSFSANCEGPN